jgi:hypothetical protein
MSDYQVTVSLGGVPNPAGWFSVKAYGAVGDGVTNDTTAIQACIDACVAAGGGLVYIPYGTYLVERLDITGAVNILGAGAGEYPTNTYNGTVLKMPNGGAAGLAMTSMLHYTIRPEQCWIKDITLLANLYGNATMKVVHFEYGADRCVVDNLQIIGWTNSAAYDRVGIQIDGANPSGTATLSYNNTIKNCFIYGMHYGVHFNGAAATGKFINNNAVVECTFTACEGTNVRIDDGSEILLKHNNFNGNSAMPTAYVEADGPWITINSENNYFDEVGVSGKPAVTISVVNFDNEETRCSIVSSGDNQPPTTFSVNKGGVWYHGKYNAATTATADDTTPSVIGTKVILIPANTVPTAITALDNAMIGQQVTLVTTSATNPSTIVDGGNFALSANWTPDINDTITLLTTNGTAWVEISRSAN